MLHQFIKYVPYHDARVYMCFAVHNSSHGSVVVELLGLEHETHCSSRPILIWPRGWDRGQMSETCCVDDHKKGLTE